MENLIAFIIIIAGIAFLAVSLLLARAMKSQTANPVHTKENSNMSSNPSVIATASADFTAIQVETSTAEVKIQYGDVEEIIVEGNNVDEFVTSTKNDRFTITEKCAPGVRTGGISIGGSVFGSSMIVSNGSITNVRQSSSGGKQTVSVNGKTISVPANASISVINGKVFVNGKEYDGQDAQPSEVKERNKLIVTIPRYCTSNLSLEASGISTIDLAGWSSFGLTATLDGSSHLKAGNLSVDSFTCSVDGVSQASFNTVDCSKARLSTDGTSKLTINKLASEELKAEADGVSHITVHDGHGRRGSLETDGVSSISLFGNFDNVSRNKNGISTITVQKRG